MKSTSRKNNIQLGFLLVLMLLLCTCTKEVWVFDSPANENLELPLLLNINGKPCALDIATKTFRFPIDADNISDFTALFEFQDYTTIQLDTIELVNESINNIGDIAINTPYTLKFTTKGEVNYYTLVFTSIPTVQIITLDKIGNEPKSFARIIVNETNPNSASINSLIGIEYRGASALNNPKKSYGFDILSSKNLDDVSFLSFFDLPENDKWILDAMYRDKAKCRNNTSFQLWTSLSNSSNHKGIASKIVEVFINYESQGVYCFNENMTTTSLNMTDASVLIMGKDVNGYSNFNKTPSSTPKSTYWEDWEQKIPDAKERLNWNDFKVLSDLIVEGSDAEFAAQIGDLMDIDNVIDYYIFMNMIHGIDNNAKNWQFLKYGPNDKFQIVPWDLDATWGRNYKGDNTAYNYVVTNALFDRLIELNPDNYIQKLQFRWNEIKYNEFSVSTIMRLFDDNFSILNTSQIITIDNQKWDKNVDITYEQNYLNTYIQEKWSFLDYYFTHL